MEKPTKNVGLVTPLAVSSLPIGFHISYDEAVRHLILNAKNLPFELGNIHKIAPGTFPIDANRNECVGWLKHYNIDISVWIDADQQLEQTTIFDLLNRGYNYPIYAGMYYLKYDPYHPVVFLTNDDVTHHRPILDFPIDKLFYADVIGMGCVKINTEVFDKLKKPYFKYQRMTKTLAENVSNPEYAKFKFFAGVNDVSEDIWFWKQVKKRTNYKIVIDPQIQVGHITQMAITYGIFKGFYDMNRERVKSSMSKTEFKKCCRSNCWTD